jgi:hypothetical protein
MWKARIGAPSAGHHTPLIACLSRRGGWKMETYTESQRVDFYGKKNRGEFSYFILFMWFLTWLAVIVMSMDAFSLKNVDDFIAFAVYILIFVLDTFIFYVGMVFRWEYKDGGVNAIREFWNKFEKGQVPRLVGLRVIEKEGKRYMEFEFYRGIFHVGIYVAVEWEGLMKFKDEWANIWRAAKKEKLITGEYRVRSGQKEEIMSEDEVRMYNFLDVIFNEKREDIIKYLAILKEYADGKITERGLNYAYQRFKYSGKI